jgi:O-antigen/teichoic acid export membrane protein
MFKKLINRYRSLQAPVKASLWFLICGFLQKGISMLTTPVFTRIMTDAEYGRFSVYNSWQGIVQIIASLNLAAGVYTRGLVKNEQDQDRFSSSMLGLSTTCILFWSAVYAIFSRQINQWLDMPTMLMTAMLVESWTHSAYQFWSNRERVNFCYKKLVAVTLGYVILRPVLGVILVLQAASDRQVEARVLATAGVNLLLFTGLYFSITRKGKHFFDKKYWLYALKFNLPLLPHYLSQIVLNQSDRLMINSIVGPSEAAYYSVAYTIAMVLQILNNSVAATMNPWIYKTIKKGEAEKIGPVSYAVLLLIGLLNVAVILIAPEVLKIMAPGSYRAAIWVIPPVTASIYFMFLYNLFATFEYYYEKTHYVAAATMIGAVLNILLNAWLIPIFGFVAAGYTTLLCYVLYSFAHYYFMKKVCAQYMDGYRVYDARLIVAVGAGVIVVSMLIMLLYNTVIIRYALLGCLGILGIAKRKSIVTLLGKMKRS